jgi:PRTRC genetic system protein B
MEEAQKLTVLTPKRLITIYYDEESHSEFYLESHSIVKGKVMEGKPLTKGMLDKLLKAIKPGKENSIVRGFQGLIPSNVLHYSFDDSNTKLMWVVPAGKRPLFFSDALQIPHGEASIPPLLFSVDDGSLEVFALLSERVTLDSPLFVAPFHNTSDDGEVCIGTAKRPAKHLSVEALIKGWENTFFNSRFTHANGTIADKLKTNINVLWSDLITSGSPFPMDCLVPNGKKVKSLLNNY